MKRWKRKIAAELNKLADRGFIIEEGPFNDFLEMDYEDICYQMVPRNENVRKYC